MSDALDNGQLGQHAVTHDSTAVILDGSLSVDQAAAHFSVSERTIHRRIKQGQLQARKVDTPLGQGWRVSVDAVGVMHDSMMAAPAAEATYSQSENDRDSTP